MKPIFILLIGLMASQWLTAQDVDSLNLTNKDAVYQRPFIFEGQRGNLSAAVGGYLEANTNYFSTDGISEGFSMEMRRFNIFLYSTIKERIKFISELEFGHGTEEIELETALLDFELHPSLIFRAGIVLVPIGYFNQNHDSPKWEFIDRPLVSTNLIPSTYSDVGFGLHGTIPFQGFSFTYETYLVNGLQESIITNEENRTFLAAGKGEERFGEDNNGSPAFTTRLALKKRKFGEIGISGYVGNYNIFKKDGLSIDEKRSLFIGAVDYNFSIKKLKCLGEVAFIKANIPSDVGQNFGNTQWGFHTDLIYPLWKGKLFRWQNIILNTALRFEYLDYNVGKFKETESNISDHLYSIMPGIGLRFSPNTLLRMNYRYQWDTDLFGNPPAKTAGFQFGFASYF